MIRRSAFLFILCFTPGCSGTLGNPSPDGGNPGGDGSAGDALSGDPGPGDSVPGDPGPGDPVPGNPGGGDAVPTSLANECATPGAGWIWCDDFEVDRSASYFEGSLTATSGVGVAGSAGAICAFTEGNQGAGGLKVAFGRTPQNYFAPVDAGTQDYREIYWRMFLRNEPAWIGGGGAKLSRATVFTSNSSWAQAMIAHIWSMGGSDEFLGMDPASGTDTAGNVVTTTYNDFANLRWLGAMPGTTPLFSSQNVGQWYCIEAHVRLNDAGSSNGIFEFWINGTLQGRHSTLNWLGDYSAYGINAVLFENYWNAGSPVDQERYFDNLVVSTQRIGCGN